MRSLRQCVMAAALVAGAATLAVAVQPPGGGGGRGMGGGPAGLLTSKTVREDLKVTDEQAEKLKEWQRESGPKMREMMKEKMKDVPQDERREKMAAMQGEMTAAVYKELAGVLKPDQVKRLKQISLQVDGLRAFANPETAKMLKVTDDQKEKLKTVTDDVAKEMRDLGGEYGVQFPGGRPADADKAKEFDKKSAALTKSAMSKVMAVMTAEQKAQYKELAGEPIDVAKVRAESMGAMGGGGKGKKKKVDD